MALFNIFLQILFFIINTDCYTYRTNFAFPFTHVQPLFIILRVEYSTYSQQFFDLYVQILKFFFCPLRYYATISNHYKFPQIYSCHGIDTIQLWLKYFSDHLSLVRLNVCILVSDLFPLFLYCLAV